MKNAEIGEIRTAREIKELYDISYRCQSRMIYAACPLCKSPRWVRIKDEKKNCAVCAAKLRRDWPDGLEILGQVEFKQKFPDSQPRIHPQVKRICPECGKARWVGLPSFTKSQLCRTCNAQRNRPALHSGPNNGMWKDEILFIDGGGYANVRIPPNNPYFPMALNSGKRVGIIKEHRLVMAQHLGRCLYPEEIVHHINGIKNDNRIENLQIVKSRQEHLTLHTHVTVRTYILKLEKRIFQLEQENMSLKNNANIIQGEV